MYADLGEFLCRLFPGIAMVLLMSFQVGCLMIRQVTAVNWSYIGDAIPSFVTIAFIPFSYSVAYGLIA